MFDLNDRQQRFVDEYLLDLNAKQAAIRAGYSEKTAEVQGARLLGHVKVREAIATAKEKRSQRAGISAARVLEELESLGTVDIAQAVEWGPEGIKVRPSSEMEPTVRRAISEISERRTANGVSVTIKFHDKLGALRLLGQHIGLFDDKAPPPPPAVVNVNLNLQEIVREELQKAAAALPRTLEEINQAHPLPPPPAGYKPVTNPKGAL